MVLIISGFYVIDRFKTIFWELWWPVLWSRIMLIKIRDSRSIISHYRNTSNWPVMIDPVLPEKSHIFLSVREPCSSNSNILQESKISHLRNNIVTIQVQVLSTSKSEPLKVALNIGTKRCRLCLLFTMTIREGNCLQRYFKNKKKSV